MKVGQENGPVGFSGPVICGKDIPGFSVFPGGFQDMFRQGIKIGLAGRQSNVSRIGIFHAAYMGMIWGFLKAGKLHLCEGANLRVLAGVIVHPSLDYLRSPMAKFLLEYAY